MTSPWAAGAIALTLVSAAFCYGEFRYGAGQDVVQAKWDAEKLRVKDVVIERQTDVAIQDRDAQVKTQKAQDHATDQTHALGRTVVGLAAERDRLRRDLDAIRADALSGTQDRSRLAAQVSALADSLRECSGRYSEVATAHDELAIQLSAVLLILE